MKRLVAQHRGWFIIQPSKPVRYGGLSLKTLHWFLLATCFCCADLLTKDIHAARRRILTSKSSNCSRTSSHKDFPANSNGGQKQYFTKSCMKWWQGNQWQTLLPSSAGNSGDRIQEMQMKKKKEAWLEIAILQKKIHLLPWEMCQFLSVNEELACRREGPQLCLRQRLGTNSTQVPHFTWLVQIFQFRIKMPVSS